MSHSLVLFWKIKFRRNWLTLASSCTPQDPRLCWYIGTIILSAIFVKLVEYIKPKTLNFQTLLPMGSLPNVKKSKKSPVHQVKKLLLEAENCSDRMGNLCSMGASAAAKKVKNIDENLHQQQLWCNVLTTKY